MNLIAALTAADTAARNLIFADHSVPTVAPAARVVAPVALRADGAASIAAHLYSPRRFDVRRYVADRAAVQAEMTRTGDIPVRDYDAEWYHFRRPNQ